MFKRDTLDKNLSSDSDIEDIVISKNNTLIRKKYKKSMVTFSNLSKSLSRKILGKYNSETKKCNSELIENTKHISTTRKFSENFKRLSKPTKILRKYDSDYKED